jgi:hypothetical protein
MNKNNNHGFEPFDFKDLDEMIEKLFGNISNLPNLGDSDPKTHHHSISYRFGTGLDKPEIRLNGEKIDNETMKEIFGNLGVNPEFHTNLDLNSTRNLPVLDVKDLSSTEIPNSPTYEDTYFEVEHEGESTTLTIELPGVEKDHIFISQTGNKVIIIGENDHTSYKAEFVNDTVIDINKTIIDGNNSIYQIKWN